jgi:hypothetical protein
MQQTLINTIGSTIHGSNVQISLKYGHRHHERSPAKLPLR